jgi:tyrosyl-tRNA synthetase
MMLRWLQKTGHRPIVLMGGGTTRIGDPSGRDEARRLLTNEAIAANMAGIKRCFARFVRFGDGPGDAVMVDNAAWLSGLGYLDFLRDYGAHFTVNRMLGFDSVKLRLEREQSLTFLEFNYMILQAYDFLALARQHGCVLQMGGSDQWGNIVSGVELARRVDGKALYGLTTPLITTASGAKMGKTARGAVWIDSALLKPYDYYQYWRNTDDKDVGRFLRLFTDLPLGEIAGLERLQGQELNDAKKRLALEATTLCHGREAAGQAAETARQTFEEGGAGGALPTLDLPAAELKAGIAAFKLFHRAGLAESGGAARRLIQGGGARLNDQPLSDPNRLIGTADLGQDAALKLSAGKKRHAIVRLA